MYKIIFLTAFLFLGITCQKKSNTLLSKGLKKEDKIFTINRFIKVKSEIKDVEYKIYDVNLNNRSIPGPSNKDFMIVIYVDPDQSEKWTKNKMMKEASKADSIDWIKEILNKEEYKRISAYPYLISTEKKGSETELKYWVNKENGIVLMRYIQI